MPQSSMTQCRSANRKYLVLFTLSSYKPLEISGPNMPKLLATTTLNTAVNFINCLHKHPHTMHPYRHIYTDHDSNVQHRPRPLTVHTNLLWSLVLVAQTTCYYYSNYSCQFHQLPTQTPPQWHPYRHTCTYRDSTVQHRSPQPLTQSILTCYDHLY